MRPFWLLPCLRRANSDLERREGRVQGHFVNRLVRLGFRLGHRKGVSVVAEKERKEESRKKSPAKHAHEELVIDLLHGHAAAPCISPSLVYTLCPGEH